MYLFKSLSIHLYNDVSKDNLKITLLHLKKLEPSKIIILF
jgi:hypothetical protein